MIESMAEMANFNLRLRMRQEQGTKNRVAEQLKLAADRL
jgi:hypothetical protein